MQAVWVNTQDQVFKALELKHILTFYNIYIKAINAAESVVKWSK